MKYCDSEFAESSDNHLHNTKDNLYSINSQQRQVMDGYVLGILDQKCLPKHLNV